MDSTVKYQLICFYLVFFALVQARPSSEGEIYLIPILLKYSEPIEIVTDCIVSDEIGNITTTESPLHEWSRGTTDECRHRGIFCVPIAECPANSSIDGICGDGKTCCRMGESKID